MAQLQSSKPVDPFQGQSILSLQPRTFRDSKVSLKSNDLEAIRQHMTSMALQNPDKLFEEAKSIIEGGSEHLNTKENSEPNMKENENPQKNRPALSRKRAQFSMKPDTSQPPTIVEPTFQMDQLHDPEDFFAAYEKFENTVKELKRQRGEDPNEPKIPNTVRQRRPEIPRRKSSYRHHVNSSQAENDTLFSQETPQVTIQSQPIQDSQRESNTPNCQSKEKEAAGSIAKAEDRFDKLFYDLMSSNIADLDGNERLSYLKDHLKIKPVAINNIQLPDFHDIPAVNLLPSINLIKDQNIFPGTRSLSDTLKEITLGKQKKLPDKPHNSLSSPTPPKSPFLAISAFGKLLSKSIETESNDPFSPRDMDLFSATTAHASKDTEFPVSASEQDLSDREQRHNMKEMDEDMQKTAEDMVDQVVSPLKLNLNVEDITDTIHCEQDVEENVEDATELSSPPEENVEITTTENNCFHSAQTDINAPVASLPVQNPDVVPEQQNEEQPKTSMNNRKRTSKVDPKRKRHSLAGGGSCWTSGIRRSNRIKSKPLEYWKGERLLYARVHNSLPTVVGVKYVSPKDNNGFKVESFVTDEYKDLVDLVSLH